MATGGDVWAFASAQESLHALDEGQVSSVELLELYLDRIEEHSWVNAVVTLDDRALAAARRADEIRAAGAPLGPLHGLPITVKHDVLVEGVLSTYGSVSLRNHVADTDAEAVARLRTAGAIVFGRTNLPEFAADGQAYNDVHGTTANPWAPDRTTGGSSGGSAAAVASGMTALDLGSDMGGSIRLPASWCGVFGLKPTWGIVPTSGAVPRPGEDQDADLAPEDVAASGPLARSAADLDLALTVLTTPRDRSGGLRPCLPAPRFSRIEDLRVLVWLDDDAHPTDGATSEVLERTCAEIESAGATVSRGTPPGGLDTLEELFEIMFMADLGGGASEADFAELQAGMELLRSDSPMAEMHARALELSHRQWLTQQRTRLRLQRDWHEMFRSFDVVLTPTVPVTALPHDHSEPVWERRFDLAGERVPWRPTLTSWCGAVGVLGLPAVTAPVGLDRHGLPVGLQVVADSFADRTAIAAAGLISTLMGGPFRPPLVAADGPP
ncbi:MAG: amidase family protein [Nocardioides sp.]|uniref:amidase family protein n=1 Tax=Nocardioides sp. TaxID=35761 RepID=UPI003264D628